VRRAGREGITLIEMMIAITLVSLLSVAMLMSIRVGLNALDSSGRRIAVNRRAMGAQKILEQQVGGFLPVVADCGVATQPVGVKAPFFEGKPQVMRFATAYSLDEAWRGLPRMVEIFVVPGQNGEGVRLVVNEAVYTGSRGAGLLCMPPAPDPLTGLMMTRFVEPQAGAGSFVLADKLAACRFLYQERTRPDLPDRWLSTWANREQWPRAIRIEMAPLATDASRVQPMTFTMPLRITKFPTEPLYPEQK
jgi:prepilin-type N-terminal cleavage/methylation domain-containing protein